MNNDDKLYEELQHLIDNRRGRTITGWVRECNDLLDKYGMPRTMQYCSVCQRPTHWQYMYVQGPKALPNETELACLSCETHGRI